METPLAGRNLSALTNLSGSSSWLWYIVDWDVLRCTVMHNSVALKLKGDEKRARGLGSPMSGTGTQSLVGKWTWKPLTRAGSRA